METPKQESDQLPEDGPADQVPDDDAAEAREDAEENAGVPDNPGQATGHPDNAG
jgi:hypothetical protein